MCGWVDVLCVLVCNLFDNVIKYMLFGGCVDVSLRVEDSVVWFVVEDSGLGILEDECICVFDCFYCSVGV